MLDRFVTRMKVNHNNGRLIDDVIECWCDKQSLHLSIESATNVDPSVMAGAIWRWALTLRYQPPLSYPPTAFPPPFRLLFHPVAVSS